MNAADKCVESAESYYGSNHSNTLDAYSLRSNFEGLYKKGREAMHDRKKCFEIIQSNVERNFTYLTATERTAYWEKYLPETTAMFAFAQKLNEQQSEFTDALYDQQLLSKGLLLTAESALQRAIDGNSDLSTAYQRIRFLRKKASDNKTNPKDAEAAILEADRIERNLGTAANSLHHFMDFLKVHSGDVKSKLGTDDVAIEFVDYRIGKDSTMYAALVMTPKWDHTRFIPLMEKKEIENNKDSIGNNIWTPVLNALGYVPNNIFFAPSGLLYQIPIESHKLRDGRYICDVYKMHRLSSTRWLAINHSVANTREAVLYGGIHYDLTTETEITHSNSTNNRTNRESSEALLFLPATLTEVESIYSIINQHPFTKCTVLTENKATESSFKSLSGRQVQLIHIATHGFYDRRDIKSSNALPRCGLCFTGANSLLGERVLENSIDGILTADEIAEMDLNGLELIVLSACETGLGNISYDGVWGLQRGFKKAGANAILMSLWKVDDEATCLLMSEFYRNWVGGMKKSLALEEAKRTIRNNPNWNNSRYWSAFILLDGFN